MLREYENSILFVGKYLHTYKYKYNFYRIYIYIYIYMSYKINISKSLQFDIYELYK